MLSLEIISMLNAETRDEFLRNSGRKKPLFCGFLVITGPAADPILVTVKNLFAIQ